MIIDNTYTDDDDDRKLDGFPTSDPGVFVQPAELLFLMVRCYCLLVMAVIRLELL